MYMSFCEECAEIIRQTRPIVESSKSYAGMCAGCFGYKTLWQFDVGLSYAELARRKARERAGQSKGGGERARAGRGRA